MAIIIGASYVMVNGLHPEFEDNLTQAGGGGDNQYTEGPGRLPSLPAKGTDAYLTGKQCRKETEQKYGKGSNSKFTKTDKSQKSPC